MASHERIGAPAWNLLASRSFLPVVAARMRRAKRATTPSNVLFLGILLLSIGCIFSNDALLRSLGVLYSTSNHSNDYQHGPPLPLSLVVTNNNTKISKSNTPLCSYELLYNAFRPNNNKTSDNRKKRDDCWTPQDDILQIPVDAILNRNDMNQLGSGSAGGVYTAILKLDGAGNVCTAALKTQECRRRGSRKGWTSCVHHESASYDDNDSSIAREFMGAFLFLATRKASIELTSLLPTWGLVVVDQEQQPSRIIRSTNITYPVIVGAVMPIRKLTTVQDIVEYEMSHLIPNTWMGVARMMLPAAEALLFMERLGMSFQDPMSKNIGIPKDDNSPSQGALIYDNTHLALLHNRTCSIKQHGNNDKLSDACNFCNKEYLSSLPRGKWRKRDTNFIFTLECQRFAKRVESLTKLLVHNNDTIQQTASEKLMHDMNDLFMVNSACQLEYLVEYLRNLTGTEAAIIIH